MKNYKRISRILVAEDDEDDKIFIKDAFKKLKILNEVTFVENGEELINNLKSPDIKLPDIIFLDLNMPIINGMQALKIIKEDSELKKIPIIVLTTSKNEEDVLKTYKIGISAYIIKPFTFDDLISIVQKTANYYFEIVTLPTENED